MLIVLPLSGAGMIVLKDRAVHLTCVCFVVCASVHGASLDELDELLREGEVQRALVFIEREFREPAVSKERRAELWLAKAKCHAALRQADLRETALQEALASGGLPPARELEVAHALVSAREAKGDREGARRGLEVLLARFPKDMRTLKRLARTRLAARDYAGAKPLVDRLVLSDASQGGDPEIEFLRGVVAAKLGDGAAAENALRAASAAPLYRRDALFELALHWSKSGQRGAAIDALATLLEEDPADERACYQLTRALLRRRAGATAGALSTYLEYLKTASEGSDRARHLRAEGKTARAAVEEALAAERRGALDVAILRLRDASETAGPEKDREAAAAIALLWARWGLFRVADEFLNQPDVAPLGVDRTTIDAARAQIGKADSPLDAARIGVATCSWSESTRYLADWLRAARAAGEGGEADRAARLLLAREPRDASALMHLVERTRSPALIAQHVHYLARLAAVDQRVPIAELLARARAALRGD